MCDTDMFNFKNTFLDLTQYTVPHGYEFTLEKYLPKGITEDRDGNFFITIGKSTTLFTSHLDTCSEICEKVNHVIDGDIIATDGTTILGADNKAGVTILLYMISQGVPGTYYFFAGEEKGLLGSKAALKNKYPLFCQFKRAISFDGIDDGILVTEQAGGQYCSDKFAHALAYQFKLNGVNYKPGPALIPSYTDSLLFTEVIPECTNLSVGVWNIHTPAEYVNIRMVEEIARAAVQVNWENLPSIRFPHEVPYLVT